MRLRLFLALLTCILLLLIATRLFFAATGVTLFFLTLVLIVTSILLLKVLALLAFPESAMKISRKFNYLALATGSVIFTLLMIEATLQLLPQAPAGKDTGNDLSLSIPEKWKRRTVQIPGSKNSYYWHNVLHVHNQDGMRWLGEFPAKSPAVFRVIAIGDSLTYGYGIAEQNTYCKVVERQLSQDFSVEVLNLGVSNEKHEFVRFGTRFAADGSDGTGTIPGHERQRIPAGATGGDIVEECRMPGDTVRLHSPQ